ncbi:MAG: 4Fe-4S binding protein [Deltaproteobacteria bacterium]|nr:4Fe-4S binding protein [Deltaproteobacteria bacterium]
MAKENYRSNACSLKILSRNHEKSSPYKPGAKRDEPVRSTFDENTAIKEANRCLVNNLCDSCDLCRYFCPDLCITRNQSTGQIEIDYDFCKGCGICAFICPKGAITMVREE